MILLKAKYAFAVFAVIFSSSAFIYDATGKTECFLMILSTITMGWLMGTAFFLTSIYYGNKIFSKLLKID